MRIKNHDMIAKPTGPGVPGYYQKYIDLIAEDDLLLALEAGRAKTEQLIRELSESQLHIAYAPGKWTIAQVLLHIMDTERVFSYRALAFVRGDQNALPGFDENAYAANDFSRQRTIKDVLQEYEAVRQATLALFGHASGSALDVIGHANGIGVSPRAIGWMIAGHEAHHCKVIRERYL